MIISSCSMIVSQSFWIKKVSYILNNKNRCAQVIILEQINTHVIFLRCGCSCKQAISSSDYIYLHATEIKIYIDMSIHFTLTPLLSILQRLLTFSQRWSSKAPSL